MGKTLFTFGYEGLTLERFIRRLEAAGVETVLDVRELPLSHKPGFSKTALAEALRKAGLAYAHLPALGCPKPIRQRYKADGDWPAYMRAFKMHLARQKEALGDLVSRANGTRACLLCFEADFKRCHRSAVAEAARRAGGPAVVHLSAQ